MAEPKPPTSDRMPKVDFQRDRHLLHQTQLDYMRLAGLVNTKRVTNLLRTKRKNVITGGLLAGGVLSIFGYSMWAVGTEKFLDSDDTLE